MGHFADDSGARGTGREASGRKPRPPEVNLLLVSDSRRWTQAVRAAAAEIGGGGVFACDAREAVVRLASTATNYTHVLVQPRAADGRLDEMVKLSANMGASPTALWLLGASASGQPRTGVIRAASRDCVRAALESGQPTAARQGWPGLSPADPSAGRLPSRHNPTPELCAALDGAVIEARYQPIVRIADRRPVALEALARLNHPGSGMVSPDQFVPQIEAAGLGAQFTDVIAAQALADLTRPPLVAQGFSLGLNFPLDVLLDPMALQRLDARRREAGIPAGRLIVELTESQPVEDIAALRNAIEGLRADGYQVWIDDVSPAVPRLRQLLQLPFSGMKFDKSLVPLLDRMPESGAFARRTVAAARAQGMTVVAEGVEDVATWRRVAELGVEQVQGFLIARPLPVAAVPVWLEAWARQPGFD